MLPFIEQQPLHNNFMKVVLERPEVVDWFGNGAYSATPIGNTHVAFMDCPSHVTSEELMSNGTNMEHLARGNYAACYGKSGYGRVWTDSPATGGLFGNQSKIAMRDIVDGTSNTIALSEVKFRSPNPTGPSLQDVRGTWAYGTMGANIFSTQTGPNSAVPDAVWGCRNFPAEGMPCVTLGSPYTGQFAAARSYHAGGVMACMADGNVRYFANTIDLLIWQGLGSRGGQESVQAP
jgi:prepilin-type processing-associated H-X9-DG protein